MATTAAGPSEGALKAAVITYSRDYLGGDATAAFALLSARCKTTVGSDELSQEVATAKVEYGAESPTSVTIESDSNGHAVVSYTFKQAEIDQTDQPWVVEDGAWKYDHC